MKKSLLIPTLVFIGISLTACSYWPKDSSVSIPKSSKVNVESKPSPAQKKAKSKEIEVFVEGNTEMHQAVLTKSQQSGYEFYILDKYRLAAEEPGKDIIYSKQDDSFFVKIEKLDKNTDLQKYKTEQLKSFKQLGQVTEIEPSTLFHKNFQNSSFSFITESIDSSGLKTSILQVAKTVSNEKFAFTFYMPLKEIAEGITPGFWAMLATLDIAE
ncbi:MAG TPA: hypothetical protein VIO64_21600 [Pseudobacteroides sp.]|uniref:hypothetical protein n=1 Tax=Pseudobacteroides sp. TaxID=1968840 RepID=UPI002F94E6C4